MHPALEIGSGPLKQALKRLIFRLLGKNSEPVVAVFCSGPEELCGRMVEEVRGLVPTLRCYVVTPENWPSLKPELKRCRIGLAPVMLADGESKPEWDALRRAAYRLAPHKILAYNSRLERHHLRLTLASFLFWMGVPLDRIWLRPWWWPWLKREHSVVPKGYRVLEGRPSSAKRRRIAILAPYVPYPLSHGGAVRIFNLLREISRDYDVELFAFNHGVEPETATLLEICARIALVEKPRYREPRWSTLLPPEVHEYRSPAMKKALAEERRSFGFETLQVEYTHLAEYGGDLLVEHDVTFDLFAQIARRERSLKAWWDYYRWRRFETHSVSRYPHVIVMSEKDAKLLGPDARCTVIENGVDFNRFPAQPETDGQRLLFVGSFQHFPNVAAYRFFFEQVWPLLRDKFPEMTLTAVCGAEHLLWWRTFAGSPQPPPDERVRLFGFVSDVPPLYAQSNIVIVPTTVSAGTNLKVLEAMAMKRAVVATTSGCAGLGMLHGHSVWVGDTPAAFAAGVATLAADPERRQQIAEAAYWHAVRNFDWRAIGKKQRAALQRESKVKQKP